MKKRFLIALTALLVFGLAVVAFALTKANTTNQTSSQTSASCPMHEQKSASAAVADKEKHSCGMDDCCKDGHCKMGGSCCKDKDSCPMKNKENKENQAGTVDYSKIIVSDESGESCCQAGASCCNGGACCKGKHG